MQARKIKYDVIGLTETGGHRPLHAIFGSELEKNQSLDHATVEASVISNNLRCQTSSYEEEELEALYMDLERLYREDHTLFKAIVGDLKGPKMNGIGDTRRDSRSVTE
uniref:Uncharacterized protein n=1 Tax=Haemonchus contortus TaxID=6289 RepID=A0A7I5ECU9_HAECO